MINKVFDYVKYEYEYAKTTLKKNYSWCTPFKIIDGAHGWKNLSLFSMKLTHSVNFILIQIGTQSRLIYYLLDKPYPLCYNILVGEGIVQ